MNIVLVSRDGDLYKLCREMLSELPHGDWHLSVATPGTCPTDADLYIWDNYIWDSQAKIDLRLAPNLSRHLFLMQRNDVAKFHQSLGGAEANILLKPVTRATLSALDRKSTRLNSSHLKLSRMPSSA